MGLGTFAVGVLPVGPFAIGIVGIGAFVAGELGVGKIASGDFSARIFFAGALDDIVFVVGAFEVGLALLWFGVGVWGEGSESGGLTPVAISNAVATGIVASSAGTFEVDASDVDAVGLGLSGLDSTSSSLGR